MSGPENLPDQPAQPPAISREPWVGKLIPTTKGRPDTGRQILLFGPKHGYQMGVWSEYLGNGGGFGTIEVSGKMTHAVWAPLATHWMELPEVPE